MSVRDTQSTELILALDVPSLEGARRVLARAGKRLRWAKIGLQLFSRHGPEVVREIADLGYQVFLDLKLMDIPNTVARATASLLDLPISMMTLHAMGGAEMMTAAREARDERGASTRLLAVTVLTSMDWHALATLGIDEGPEEEVLRLARLALVESGLDGLICSPVELRALREEFGAEALMVTPGVRPAGSETHEQKRVTSPAVAAAQGASFVVVGRPILEANDPARVVEGILAELQAPADG